MDSLYIILVNWNSLELTMQCLESLEKIKYSSYKIILIDNGSVHNPTDEISAKYPNVTLITLKENIGFCKANNIGINHALSEQAKYILLLNNDTVVNEDFASYLVEKLKSNPDLGAVTSMIYYLEKERNKIWALGGEINFWFGNSKSQYQGIIEPDEDLFPQDFEVDYSTGCCLLIPTSVVKQIGLLDEAFFAYYEDSDYSMRLRKRGLKLAVVKKSKVWHVAGGSSYSTGRLNPFILFLNVRNRIWFFRRHSSIVQKFVVYPVLTAKFSVYGIYFLLFFKASKLKALVKAIKEGVFKYRKKPTWSTY